MESFYGGRQGSSFIIVKRFDGIKSPATTESQYTAKYFAFDIINQRFISDNNGKAIERIPGQNDKDYANWKLHITNGQPDDEIQFPKYMAEYMVDCFKKGSTTLSEVNYGEYVIIDTANKNDLDNGKVYRRGLNFRDEVLGGAEYVGQIVGPIGNSPEVYIDKFTTIQKDYDGTHLINEAELDDVVPGMDKDQFGQIKYNDAIHSTWVTLRDEFGVITGCKIGFQFPYHVFEFTAEGADPYTTGELAERIDEKEHPYYSKWRIKVPKGKKGDSITDLQIVNSMAKAGAKYYADKNCTQEQATLTSDTSIAIDNENYLIGSGSKPIQIGQTIYYVKNEDTYKNIVIYKATTFDTYSSGESDYVIVGDYNMIKNIEVEDDGTLVVEYTFNETKRFNKKIKWIDDINIDTNKVDAQGKDLGEASGSQKIQVIYNNEEVVSIGNPINYIVETVVTSDRELLSNRYKDGNSQLVPNVAQNEHLLVIYSDPEYRKKLKNEGKCKIWKSNKLNQDDEGYFDEWYDLGEVRGMPGTVKVAKIYTPEEAAAILNSSIPPEELFGNNNKKYEGWLIGVQGEGDVDSILYHYNYEDQKWVRLGIVTAHQIEDIVQVVEDMQDVIPQSDQGIVFIKDDKKRTIKNLKQKIPGQGNYSDAYYFNTLAKYINSTLNAGVNNLEEQLLIGMNTIKEEKIDSDGRIYITTRFLSDILNTKGYYLLKTVKEPENSVEIETGFILMDDSIQFNHYCEFDEIEHNLLLDSTYCTIEDISNSVTALGLKVQSVILQTDTLYYCSEDSENEDDAIKICEKQTTIQTLSNNHKITKESIQYFNEV